MNPVTYLFWTAAALLLIMAVHLAIKRVRQAGNPGELPVRERPKKSWVEEALENERARTDSFAAPDAAPETPPPESAPAATNPASSPEEPPRNEPRI